MTYDIDDKQYSFHMNDVPREELRKMLGELQYDMQHPDFLEKSGTSRFTRDLLHVLITGLRHMVSDSKRNGQIAAPYIIEAADMIHDLMGDTFVRDSDVDQLVTDLAAHLTSKWKPQDNNSSASPV